jgi:hypothetical protein
MSQRTQSTADGKANRPLDYLAAVTYAFKHQSRHLSEQLKRRYLMDDWHQEIRLAAWQAEQKRLGVKETFRFARREAHRALKDMGFRQRKGRGYVPMDRSVWFVVCRSRLRRLYYRITD